MQFYWLASLAVSLLVVTSICKSEIATISCVFETRSPSAASNCVVQGKPVVNVMNAVEVGLQ